MMVLKEAPLPVQIKELERRDQSDLAGRKAEGRRMKRAKTLLSAAEHSVGSQEAPEAASMEIWNLLEDYEKYSSAWMT